MDTPVDTSEMAETAAPVAEAAVEAPPVTEAKPKRPRAAAKAQAPGFDFSSALLVLKMGQRVERAGWNGKGMWLVLVNAWQPVDLVMGEAVPFIAMKTADGKLVPWSPSQTDVLANDWRAV